MLKRKNIGENVKEFLENEPKFLVALQAENSTHIKFKISLAYFLFLDLSPLSKTPLRQIQTQTNLIEIA